MADELKNYLSGDAGNPYAPGAGQLGYQNHLHRQERERARLKKAMELPRRSGATRAPSQPKSLKGLFLFACAFALATAIWDFGDQLSQTERIVLGIGASVSGVVLYRYWDILAKLVRIAFTVALIGGLLGAIGYALLTAP